MASLTKEAASYSSSSLPRSSTDHQNHYTYEVFLSFRGEDTRFNFTDHLYTALCQRGIETFRDDKLSRGEDISQELLKAIDESRVSIIVFSQNYAASRWCLDELVKILECRKSKGQEVRAVFYKVDPSDVRHQRGAFGDAFATLDQCKYKDSMDKWKAALKEAADLSGWPFKDGQYESKFINDIVGELSARVIYPSCELQVAANPIGIESCRQDVNRLLNTEENIVRMVGIWGPGGIGKTTIAKDVFNSIRQKFEGSCFLADVTSNGLTQLQERLLFNSLRDPTLKVNSVDEGVSLIKTRMRHKKILLILDDVSRSNQLQNLVPSPNCFGPGSRILITTRDKRWLIAHQVDEVYEVKMLDYDQALELFSLNAFKRNGPPSDYLKLARRAICYAQGLPLALIVLGSHLFRRSREEWEATLDSCREDPHKEIRNVLKISYDALGADLKEYFLDIACFFKGECVDRVKPILEACYDLKSVTAIGQLQEKALIRIDGDEIWMHDLIEEMGKDIVYQESPGEPGGRSRVWSIEDLNHILTNNTNFPRLTWMNLRGCDSLTELPDFSGIPNLKILNPYGCSSLVEVPDSVGFLRNLVSLGVGCCSNLIKFPRKINRKYVETISLRSRKLEEFSEVGKEMGSLKILDLSGTCIKELDESIGNLIGLKKLKLLACQNLTTLSRSIYELRNLQVLDASNCPNLATLPCSIYGLQNLKRFELRNCPKLVRFPTNTKILNVDALSLPKLEWFSIAGCSLLSDCDFLMTLDCWETLWWLNLSRNNFVSLPACLTKFVKLRGLDLRDCKRLRGIPELPPYVRPDISGCESLTSTSTKTDQSMESMKA
ncbi:hypothetical protein ABKV19_025188, partial [Rosa sericea]